VKVIKLTIAAFLSAVACLSYLYLFDYNSLYGLYRCHRYAPKVSHCWNDKAFDFSIDFYGMNYLGNTGNLIDRHVLFWGAWEKPILYFMRDVMILNGDKDKIFVDVGANVGQHSMFMSRYSKTIHAFEPYEPVLKKFRAMVGSNHLTNITIHSVGLGSEHSKKLFYKPAETNTGTGSFLPGFITANSKHEKLEIVRGDDALNEAAVNRVTLIKMDIEGFEKPALEGLRRVLEASRPIIVFEMSLSDDNPVAFKNRQELDAAFPKNYQF
jgi:FkbM family methyltransferase